MSGLLKSLKLEVTERTSGRKKARETTQLMGGLKRGGGLTQSRASARHNVKLTGTGQKTAG